MKELGMSKQLKKAQMTKEIWLWEEEEVGWRGQIE